MVRDIRKLPDNYSTDSFAGRVRYNGIYRAIVKANEDPQCMGRLAVWIPEICGDPTQEASWIICSYGSPFAGVTPRGNLVEDATNMEGSQSSYGMWFVPPHIDTEVLVCFANGDTAQAFWIGCVYQQNMNHMVPGIAGGTPAETFDACGSNPPVVEYNKFSKENQNAPKRPIFTPLAEGIAKQGLFQDPSRGVSQASARRAPISNVYGWNTPRGHTIYVDEEEGNEYIRMRTRQGAQVLINDTTGFVYINSKNGDSWLSISDKGIDAYSRGAISMRAEGSLNLHADGSLNIEADGNLNLRAGGNLTFQSANHTHFAGNGDLALEFGGVLSGTGGSRLVLGSGGDIQLGASGTIYNGAGGDHIISAGKLLHNTGASASVSPVKASVAQPNTLAETQGDAPCYQQGSRPTITTRLPTHEPFAGHPTGSNPSPDPIQPSEVASADDRENVIENGNSSVVTSTLNENFTDDDLTWLTICVWTESRGENDDGRAAVARTVLNRYQHNFRENNMNDKFAGVKKYVLAQNAFSHFWFPNAYNRGSVKKGDYATAEKRGIEVYTKNKSTALYKKIEEVCRQVMAGTYKSTNNSYNIINANRKSAMWFYNPSTSSPSWASSLRLIGKIGGHNFLMRK